ncbi:arsenate reductase, partial [Pseudomonas syringae pv. actinidiae ICMP 18807]
MTDLTLYHNPRCTKSRGALELLQARGLTPDIILYLETPPDAATLHDLLGKLGISARKLLRTGEDDYKQLNLADPSLSDEQLVAAMAAHPFWFCITAVMAPPAKWPGRSPAVSSWAAWKRDCAPCLPFLPTTKRAP